MMEIRSLSRTFSKRPALRDVNLKIESESITALLGPNGSGKSTLLKIIMGHVLPDPGGDVLLDGESVIGKTAYRKRIAYMPQVPSFPDNLRVREILTFLERLTGDPVEKARLMEEMQVDSFYDRRFGQLSQGMKQKVNILQCFSFRRDIFIIDEPTAGLDPYMAYYLKELVMRKKAEGGTVLFTSHVMSEVEELADRMAVLVEGSLIVCDEPGSFIQSQGAVTLEEAVRHFWRTDRL